MTQSIFKLHLGQAPKESFLGGVMQRQILKSHRELLGNFASRFGALLAMTGLLLLSACDSGSAVTENNLVEPGKDGVPPTLTTVTIEPDGFVALGQSVRVDLVASEALMTPVVFINGVKAEVTGSINSWRAVREMTEADTVGEIYFTIAYQDISGELGQPVDMTTDGSAAEYCAEDCPTAGDLGPLEGNWKLDFAGLGANEGDSDWFNISDTGIEGERYCWFNDTYQFGRGGSFRNVQGDETWLEAWQGAANGCGAPIAPHDGSNNAAFEYDEEAATLKLTGLGAFLGISKAVNGAELTDPAETPEFVTYNVVELIGDSLTVSIYDGNGWWTFELSRISTSPVVGNWKLNFAGLGLNEGDTDWFNISDTGPEGERACWFDDIYHFGDDASFQIFQEGETWLEAWQGAANGCGVPIAPHDGSSAGAWSYDEDGGTLTLDGLGAYLAISKAVNGAELTDPAETPEFVTYNVVELIGDSLTVRIYDGNGWWEYRLAKD